MVLTNVKLPSPEASEARASYFSTKSVAILTSARNTGLQVPSNNTCFGIVLKQSLLYRIKTDNRFYFVAKLVGLSIDIMLTACFHANEGKVG